VKTRIAVATRPTGRLTQKTQRQETWVTRKPPTSGPSTLEVPQTVENRPWTKARCSASYRSPKSVMVIGSRPPAPSPWSPRKRISATIELAVPQSSDPSRKKNTATR